jgi:hypothetical protein
MGGCIQVFIFWFLVPLIVAIPRNLGTETRPIVQGRLARFLGEGTSSSNTDPDAQQFMANIVVPKIWEFVKSPHAFVRREAYRSLSRYAEWDVETLGNISTIECSNLLKSESDQDARKEAENLVVAFLKLEIGQRRSTQSSGTSSNSSLEVLSDLSHYLKNQYDSGSSRYIIRSFIYH